MKHLTFILLITFSHSVINAQIPDQQKQRQQSWDALKDTTLKMPIPQSKKDTIKDFPLNFRLTKEEFKQQKKIDSCYSIAYKYLPVAAKNKYDRIVVTIIKGGLFSDEKISIIDVKKTIDELQKTGKVKVSN